MRGEGSVGSTARLQLFLCISYLPKYNFNFLPPCPANAGRMCWIASAPCRHRAPSVGQQLCLARRHGARPRAWLPSLGPSRSVGMNRAASAREARRCGGCSLEQRCVRDFLNSGLLLLERKFHRGNTKPQRWVKPPGWGGVVVAKQCVSRWRAFLSVLSPPSAAAARC